MDRRLCVFAHAEFQAGPYFRAFNQAHVDGNPTSLTPCPPFSCVNGSPAHDTFGGIIPDISQNGTLDLAEIDRNWTQSRSLGGSLQAVDTDKINGRDNTLTVGASLDYGWTRFTGNSQFGAFYNDNNTSFPITPIPTLSTNRTAFWRRSRPMRTIRTPASTRSTRSTRPTA